MSDSPSTSRALHPIEASPLHARRERVFLVLSGLFLGSLTMLNILGVTRFIKLFEVDQSDGESLVFAVAVGVLPYPVTFLCTDFISEIYGRRRANAVVWTGLLLNVWVVTVLWIGGLLPGFETVDPESRTLVKDAAGRLPVFFEVRALAFTAVVASMIAYLVAQLVDVSVFHFWKNLTKGRALWLRNCGSTVVSQFIDTIAVIYLTFYFSNGLAGVVKMDEPIHQQLWLLIATGYVFKFAAAVLDTPVFYIGTRWLRKYLDAPDEHMTGGSI